MLYITCHMSVTEYLYWHIELYYLLCFCLICSFDTVDLTVELKKYSSSFPFLLRWLTWNIRAWIVCEGRLYQVGQERCDCRMLETKVRLYRSTRVIVWQAHLACERDLEVKRPSGGDANDAQFLVASEWTRSHHHRWSHPP